MMKILQNKNGFEFIELMIAIVIILILAAIAVNAVLRHKNDVKVNVKPEVNFSQDDLYSSKEKPKMKEVTKEIPEEVKNKLLFNAKLMGKMTCEGYLVELKVYEFCYKGVKYFAIEGGYMSPVMIKTCNSKPRIEMCEE